VGAQIKAEHNEEWCIWLRKPLTTKTVVMRGLDPSTHVFLFPVKTSTCPASPVNRRTRGCGALVWENAMKWFGRFILVLVTIPVLMIGFEYVYGIVFTHVYRYRLTLEVTVNDKPHAGSGVIGVSVTESAGLFLYSSSNIHHGVRGEAVVVDLGERGALFVLLQDIDRPQGPGFGASPEYIVQSAFPPVPGPDVMTSANMRRYARGGEKRDLKPGELPLLVRFRDISDPKTVERVDPSNLAATFGAGVKLTRVTIETVPSGYWPFNLFGIGGEPVTRRIEKRLGWLAAPWEKQRELLKGPYWDSSDPNYVYGKHLTLDYFQLGR
jgi:hypothetical protein